ncbi:orotidine-5'-phosphate decarboxylase [candidate division KSB1 bacterium]|nr:orotidine-5'-phosphate decarboxylase [candidate division KSB1 bacterium]
MKFNDALSDICTKKNSHLCVGLDVDLTKVPAHFNNTDDPLVEFGKAIIQATSEYAAAFKINTAFFEAYGVPGWQALAKLSKILPDDVIKIADAKRGDIGNTSRMYARAFFREMPFDCITVNPYLGHDAVSPFIEDEEKGAFILCVTSNKGAADFQYLEADNKTLYSQIARKVDRWNESKNCGLVVGATHPDEIRKVREIAPELPFLIPGIGAQGGDLELSVRYSMDKSRAAVIFNSSRGIIYASQQENFAEMAAQKSKQMRDAINALK